MIEKWDAVGYRVYFGNGGIDLRFFSDADKKASLIATAPDLFSFVQEWLDRQGTDENYMTAKARSIIAKAANA